MANQSKISLVDEEEFKRAETTNFKLYKLNEAYKSSTNLDKHIENAQNFYNGNQYPNENYNNMIRVTLNICSFAANIKASKIVGTPIYLAYTADNPDTDCNALRQFDEYNCNKMKLKSSNFQAALNGFVNGTEITFVRWDEDDTTYKGIYKGGLVEEHIDVRHFAVANPYIGDIQNQAWVMFWEDYAVDAVKEMVEGASEEIIEKKKEMIEREGSGKYQDDYKEKELINHGLCRVYTRFFRVDGEVYFMCSTDKVDLFEYPHPLSRKTSETVIKKVVKEYKESLKKKKVLEEEESSNLVEDYHIDYEDLVMCTVNSKAFSDDEYKQVKEKFSLYPFAVYKPFGINRSFYGRSDVSSLIPVQKGINFIYSMMLKCAENNAYNKIFAKPDSLKGQKISNEPGQLIYDYSQFTNGWGIKMAESQPMPNGLIDFADRLFNITRVVYGFNDVMDGSLTNQDMSGYMLQQMIKQANTSIEQQQQLFWVYNEDKAAIRLMFYKHYVDKAKYTTELDDAEYDSQEQSRQMIYNRLQNGHKLASNPDAKPEDFENPVHKVKVLEITNEDMYGINFDISIEALQGLQDSKLVEQQMWDNLLLNGGIQNISPEVLEMYFTASPNVSPRTKAAFKTIIEKQKKSEITALRGQLQQLSQKTQEIMDYAKKLETTNGYQSEYLKNLQSEFGYKINAQNKIINGLASEMQKKEGVPEGEAKSMNSRGIDGADIAEQGVQQ